MDNKTFIGTFQSENEVIRKIEELKAQGYEENDIYVVAKDENDISMVRGRTNAEVQSADGSWIDRFMAFLSGEEPVRGALLNMGLSESEANRYYNDIQDGSVLLYVDKEYGRLYDTGSNIVDPADENLGPDPLNRQDYNMTADTESVVSDTGVTSRDMDEERRLQLHEEKLNVDKERVQSGEVRVEKNIVEEEQTVDVPVSREEVYIERRPVDREATGKDPAAVFDEDENIRIPLMEEKVEVSKKPMVSEEIVIGKRQVKDTETVSETVKREEADIDRSDEMRMKKESQISGEWNRNGNGVYNEHPDPGFGDLEEGSNYNQNAYSSDSGACSNESIMPDKSQEDRINNELEGKYFNSEQTKKNDLNY